MMRRSRLVVVLAGLGSLGLIAASLIDCAQPTQIIVEVFSDACPAPGRTQVINATGIAVGTAANIDERRPSAYRQGCESTSGVGSLTVYPSGGNDDEVALKVVSGVERSPDQCNPPDYAGCIVHRRMMRFVPHTTQHAIVNLTLACLNRTCPKGTTCDKGACVSDRDVLADGGTVDDASRSESGAADGAADAGFDACTGCKGTCDNTTCVVDCTAATPCTGEQCSPSLPCTINCPKTSSCNDVRCSTSQACTIKCGVGGPGTARSCGKVTCNASDCKVECNGNDSCNTDGGIVLDAGHNGTLSCIGENACNTASCNAVNTCTLSCMPAGGMKNACPMPAPCNAAPGGGCDPWTQPNGGN